MEKSLLPLLFVSLQKEIRSSLVLSMLQQMLAEDKADMVREAVIQSLGIIMGYIDDPDKYAQVRSERESPNPKKCSRCCASHSFKICLLCFFLPSRQGFELMLLSLADPSERVVSAVHQVFIPAFAAWTTELGTLHTALIPSLLARIEKLLSVSPSCLHAATSLPPLPPRSPTTTASSATLSSKNPAAFRCQSKERR